MSHEARVNGVGYRCGECGAEVERDLLAFLRHTDQHILEALKALHPEWVDGEQAPKIREYYRAQLGHDPW